MLLQPPKCWNYRHAYQSLTPFQAEHQGFHGVHVPHFSLPVIYWCTAASVPSLNYFQYSATNINTSPRSWFYFLLNMSRSRLAGPYGSSAFKALRNIVIHSTRFHRLCMGIPIAPLQCALHGLTVFVFLAGLGIPKDLSHYQHASRREERS